MSGAHTAWCLCRMSDADVGAAWWGGPIDVLEAQKDTGQTIRARHEKAVYDIQIRSCAIIADTVWWHAFASPVPIPYDNKARAISRWTTPYKTASTIAMIRLCETSSY